MDDYLTFQYVLVGLIVIFASYSLFRIIRKTFTSKKKGKGEFGCDSGCNN